MPQGRERGSDPPLVANLAPDRQALLMKAARQRVVALVPCTDPLVVEHVGDPALVAQLTEDSQALLEQKARNGEVAQNRAKTLAAFSTIARGLEGIPSHDSPSTCVSRSRPSVKCPCIRQNRQSAAPKRKPRSASRRSTHQRSAARKLSCSTSRRSNPCSSPATLRS